MPRQLNIQWKKKLRGVRRRLHDVLAMPERYGHHFPEKNRWGYFDYKLPVNQALVEGPHAKLGFMKQCAQSLLDLCAMLHERRGDDAANAEAKVFASIDFPGMFSSRVTIVWDKAYYESFFERSGPYQTWTPAPEEQSLVSRWNLDSHGLRETCFIEKMVDDETELEFDGKLYFFGDVPDIR